MARIVAGAGLHRRLDRSLQPVLRAIGSSLGPDGRGVLYDKGGMVGRAVTGFAIAREMPISEGPDGVAPRLLKEVLFAADRDWSDGTARLALIAGGCFSGGAREVEGGISQRPLCEAIRRLAGQLSDAIDGERASPPDLLAVARGAGAASAHAERFAALVTDLGSEGIFDVKENSGRGVEVTRSQGFVFDAKTLGEEALSDLASVNVLVADEIIQDFGTLAPVLEGFASKRKALVIAARDITGAALATLRRNQQADIVTVAALQPSDAGQRAADGLEDLAIATGATLIAERFGVGLDRVRPAMLGAAAGFRFSGGMATFLAPKGKAEDVAFRRRLLFTAAEKARHLAYDRDHFERRRARLAGQWCELRIAGATGHETEALIRTTRSALEAMQQALRTGALSGGGGLYAGLALRLAGGGGGAAERAAARAMARGLLAIPHHLAANRGAGGAVPTAMVEPVQDPLRLTKSIVNQGIGLAVTLLETGVLVAR